MMENKINNYKVTICGTVYALVSNEPEEQIVQAAAMVDSLMKEHINKASKSLQIDEKKLAILIALKFASKIIQLEKEADTHKQISDRLVGMIDQAL